MTEDAVGSRVQPPPGIQKLHFGGRTHSVSEDEVPAVKGNVQWVPLYLH